VSLLNDISEALSDFESGGVVRLTHFSHVDGLTEIDPEKMFSGADRSNREIRSITGKTFPRAYFGIGVGEEGGYSKERALKNAPYEYTVDYPAKHIYDMNVDPDGLKEVIGSQQAAARDAHPNKMLPPDESVRIMDTVVRSKGYHGIAFDNPSFGQSCYLWLKVKVEQVQ
jgi:hypothetical protein